MKWSTAPSPLVGGRVGVAERLGLGPWVRSPSDVSPGVARFGRPGDSSHFFASAEPCGDECVLGCVVEWVLESLLNSAARLGSVLGQPLRGLSPCVDRLYKIAVAEIVL